MKKHIITKLTALIALIAAMVIMPNTVKADKYDKAFKKEFKTKVFTVSKAHGIKTNYFFNIKLKKGTSNQVKVSTFPETLPYVEVKVKEGIIVLSLAKGKEGGIKTRDDGRVSTTLKDGTKVYGPIDVELELNDLDYIDLSGVATLEVVGNATFTADEFQCDISGVSTVTGCLVIEARKLNLDLSGCSKLDLKASKLDEADLELSGASKVTIKGDMRKMDAEVSGCSHFDFAGDCSEEAELDISGASNVKCIGNTNLLDLELSGASKFSGKDFKTKEAKIDVSGASNGSIYVSEKVIGEVTGASDINCYGHPKSYDVGPKRGFQLK